jgi:5-methylcytosine-specific restriction protein B
MELNIKGLFAHDSTGWQRDFKKGVETNGCGIMWKNHLSDWDEIIPQLKKLIEDYGSFPFYNLAQNKVNYKFNIIDFATKDDYETKKNDWKIKNPFWYKDRVSDYQSGTQKAKIVFLVDKVEETKTPIHHNDFVNYNKNAGRRNAAAFKYIKAEISKEMKGYTDLLEKKKNIILQGAPGVGKTYTTAALALSICGETVPSDHADVMKRYEQLQKKGRIGFVTFHQSMDYEDFVEGIKPSTNNDTITYDVEDGIFKQIANKANKNLEDSKKTIEQLTAEEHAKIVFNTFCKTIQKQLDEEGFVDLSDKTTLKIRKIKYKDEVPFAIQLARVDSNVCQSLTFDIIQRDYHNYKAGKIKSYTEIAPRYESKSAYHGNANYYFALFEKMSKCDNTPTTTPKVAKQNYVLIIDEINRGNVSKIFGELITLLEADKRIDGDHHIKVTLPYSKEEFGVPSNLYIIGTMNTTDRSVGNIDYAVRRRFAFVTLKSKRIIVEENSIQKALKLFDAVETFIKTNQIEMDFEDLMVGHSYFIAKDEAELKMKWDYEIIPLLREYYKDGLLKQDVTPEIAVGTWRAASLQNQSDVTQSDASTQTT